MMRAFFCVLKYKLRTLTLKPSIPDLSRARVTHQLCDSIFSQHFLWLPIALIGTKKGEQWFYSPAAGKRQLKSCFLPWRANVKPSTLQQYFLSVFSLASNFFNRDKERRTTVLFTGSQKMKAEELFFAAENRIQTINFATNRQR